MPHVREQYVYPPSKFGELTPDTLEFVGLNARAGGDADLCTEMWQEAARLRIAAGEPNPYAGLHGSVLHEADGGLEVS